MDQFPIDQIPGYNPNALYLGVENTAKASHHYYVILGKQRFEVKTVPGLSSVHESKTYAAFLGAAALLGH
jgi:hypothetical protein